MMSVRTMKIFFTILLMLVLLLLLMVLFLPAFLLIRGYPRLPLQKRANLAPKHEKGTLILCNQEEPKLQPPIHGESKAPSQKQQELTGLSADREKIISRSTRSLKDDRNTPRKQYDHFWKTYRKFKFPRHLISTDGRPYLNSQNGTIQYLGYDPAKNGDRYTYNVTSAVVSEENNSRITVNVMEFYEKQLTKGGSYLRAISLSDDIPTMCSFVDHFNGSYTVNCPFFAPCGTIEISLLYVNFTQFKGIGKELQKLLFKCDLCVGSSSFSNKPDWYWFKTKTEPLFWKLNYFGTEFPSKLNICDIMKYLGNIYLFGADFPPIKPTLVKAVAAALSSVLSFKSK